MSGQNATTRTRLINGLAASVIVASPLFLGLNSAHAQSTGATLEEIVVTAQKREEALQDVPISIATLSGERYDVLFSGSEDILALSGRVPGLYAESSNGRAAPRFYLRGLGNIDFDLAASQPVSIVMDEVVMENVVLKSFPLFDMDQVEVIRGPQGTLFGRNTTAGIIKFNTMRPAHETSGYLKGSYATFDTINLEGAWGGSLIDDTLAARVSFLTRSRDNWITNGFTGEQSLGDYDESAGRIQLLWTPGDTFSALASYQRRDLDGTSSIFRANVFNTGDNTLNQNYDRELVFYNEGDDNPQGYNSTGFTLNLTWDFDEVSVTSISSWQEADGFSRGDIDGGVVDFSGTATIPDGITFDPAAPVFGGSVLTFPGTILVPSVTQDGADTDQFTQEFRIASDTDGPFNYQLGAFYFDSSLLVTTEAFSSSDAGLVQDTIVGQDNTTWAVFGQVTFEANDDLTITAGARYTDDEKDFRVVQFGALYENLLAINVLPDVPPINVEDDRLSWEIAGNARLTDTSSLYARFANGFRAQTIQGRDVAFLETPTVAEPETIDSFEFGYKADLLDNKLRLNIGVFKYEVEDLQLSIIGGATNTNQVINADKGEAFGFEIDADLIPVENALITFGFSYNDTEIRDADLATVPCGSGLCTPIDPLEDPRDPNNRRVLLDGNPFPRAPETTVNFSFRYAFPIDNNSEFYFLTDWAWYGDINMPLYESLEFSTDQQYEGGLRVAYRNNETGWEFAAFGRNITDEDNVLGFIDFSNNTGFVNEPQIWGVEARYDFGD